MRLLRPPPLLQSADAVPSGKDVNPIGPQASNEESDRLRFLDDRPLQIAWRAGLPRLMRSEGAAGRDGVGAEPLGFSNAVPFEPLKQQAGARGSAGAAGLP
eukprot:gene15004-biopygen7051